MTRFTRNNDDAPLVYINWSKLWRGIKKLFIGIVLLLKKFIETILKLILKFFILVLVTFLKIYKLIKFLLRKLLESVIKFSKKNIKGIWLLLLTFLFILVASFVVWRGYLYLKDKENEIHSQSETNSNLFNENERLKEELKLKQEEIEDKDKQLQAKRDEEVMFANQQRILVNRDTAEEKLPEYVKETIKKYADEYGVEDLRLMECIVFNESGGRSEAIGDSGKAIGVAQYHLATFLGHRRQMGLPQEDLRTDIDASIQAMMFSVSRGGIGNWTARHKCI
jgi:hypothetical protein